MPCVRAALAGYWVDMTSDERRERAPGSEAAVEQLRENPPLDREITIVTFRNCRGEVVCLDW